ncbi:MAG: peptidylprolyl isomerase [Sphingomicrobium sp.]
MQEVLRAGSTRLISIIAATSAVLASAAIAQQAVTPATPEPVNSAKALRLPTAPQLFGSAMPSVIKATAIVNSDVITQTDIDQRLGLLAIANDGEIPQGELQTLREQILRNLIDETLQIQSAKDNEIEIKTADVDKAVERIAGGLKQTPLQLAQFLQSKGSSIESMRRQVLGELSWQRLQRKKIESGISVGDDEVKAVIERMNAAKGTEEYHVGEIYLSAIPGAEAQTLENANRILQQLRTGGASFPGYARQYSEASTAAVGGDLGWVRPEQMPEPLAAALRQMSPGAVSNPIAVPGGVSLVALIDTRRVLTADPRDAVLMLKQVSINFPKGSPKSVAEPQVARFAEAARNIGGCGGAERIATEFRGEVVQSDQVKLRDLPPALQQVILPMQVGQATQPFGSLEEGVRILVICGRDEGTAGAPNFDQIYNQMTEERINVRSRRYLRDLRRDAVIEFR